MKLTIKGAIGGSVQHRTFEYTGEVFPRTVGLEAVNAHPAMNQMRQIIEYTDQHGIKVEVHDCDLVVKDGLKLLLFKPAKVEPKPVAWMRRWYHDNEKEYRERNPKTGRMALATKFKYVGVSSSKLFDDDVPLYT